MEADSLVETPDGQAPSDHPVACWACRCAIDPGDPYCRWCGRRQQVDGTHWYFRPFWIVFMTLTVLGPFTLPLVWRSPALSRSQRWGLTAFIVGISIFVLWLFYLMVVFSIQWFNEIDSVSRDYL
jgi:hypothetical protein